jgi:hypothetical protein
MAHATVVKKRFMRLHNLVAALPDERGQIHARNRPAVELVARTEGEAVQLGSADADRAVRQTISSRRRSRTAAEAGCRPTPTT